MSFINDHPYLTGFFVGKIMSDAQNASMNLQNYYEDKISTVADETMPSTEKSCAQPISIYENSDSKPFFFPFYLGLITGITLCCLLPIVEIITFIINL